MEYSQESVRGPKEETCMSAKTCSKGKEMESCLSYRIGKCCDEEGLKKQEERMRNKQ